MAVGLEQLIVQIGADVTDLKKALVDSEKGLDGFEKKTRKSTQGASASVDSMAAKAVSNLKAQAAAFASVTAAVLIFQNALNNTSALGRLSQVSGIAVENLSALQNAAATLGIEAQTIQQAISGWAQRTAELADPLSTVSIALQQMGVNVRDARGGVRNLADLLPDLADRFARYRDGVDEARLASQLFGEEAGPKLLPLLNQGRSGIAALTEEAKKLGVVTADQVRQADEYQAATTRMNTAISQLTTEFAIRLAPAVTVVANAITTLISLLPRQRSEQEQNLATLRQLELQYSRAGPAERGFLEESIRLLKEKVEQEKILAGVRNLNNQGMGTVTPPDPVAGQRAAQEAMAQAQFQLQQLTERLSGQRSLFDELNFQWRTHAEIVAEATEKINRAYATQGERARAVATLKKNLATAEQQQMLDTASLAASTLTALFPQQKGAAIAAAVINTAVGITKALSSLLPPWSWIQAGLIAASGAAQIATIRATSERGGPTPSVGGGGAGASTPVPGGTPADTSGGRSLSITGIDPASIFTGRIVGSLIEAINNEVQNGATLITTRLKPT